MFIKCIFALESLLVHPVPVSALQVNLGDAVQVDLGSSLRHVCKNGEKPPLSEEGDVILWRDDGVENAGRVAGGEDVDEEEIVFDAAGSVDSCYDESCCSVLGVVELLGGVGGDFERIPVFEDD